MEDHERNLMIVLCLGTEIRGHESRSALEQIVSKRNAQACSQEIQPLQAELANWLNLSLEQCATQLEASLKLWNSLDDRGYSLADVPTKIRRKAFGGSLDIQKRLARRRPFHRLLRQIRSLLRTVVTLAIVAMILWLLWKFLLLPQIQQS